MNANFSKALPSSKRLQVELLEAEIRLVNVRSALRAAEQSLALSDVVRARERSEELVSAIRNIERWLGREPMTTGEQVSNEIAPE